MKPREEREKGPDADEQTVIAVSGDDCLLTAVAEKEGTSHWSLSWSLSRNTKRLETLAIQRLVSSCWSIGATWRWQKSQRPRNVSPSVAGSFLFAKKERTGKWTASHWLSMSETQKSISSSDGPADTEENVAGQMIQTRCASSSLLGGAFYLVDGAFPPQIYSILTTRSEPFCVTGRPVWPWSLGIWNLTIRLRFYLRTQTQGSVQVSKTPESVRFRCSIIGWLLPWQLISAAENLFKGNTKSFFSPFFFFLSIERQVMWWPFPSDQLRPQNSASSLATWTFIRGDTVKSAPV